MEKKTFLYMKIGILLLLFVPSALMHASDPSEALAWRFALGGKILTRPVLSDEGDIYIVSEDRYLYRLNSEGEKIWRSSLDSRPADILSLGPDGTIYTGDRTGVLTAYNKNGKKIWRFSPDSPIQHNPAISSDGTIFLTTRGKKLIALSHTGRIRWSTTMESEAVAPPVLGKNGVLYVSCADEKIYAYSREGIRLWTFLCAGVPSIPAIGSEGLFVTTNSGTLVAIDYSGDLLWSRTLVKPLSSPVLTAEGVAVTGGEDSLFYFFFNGNQAWRCEVRFPAEVAVSSGGSLVSISRDGLLNRFNTDGVLEDAIRIHAPLRGMTIGQNGIIFLGGDDWILYAVQTPDSGQPGPLWPAVGGFQENRGTEPGEAGRDISSLSTGSDFRRIYFSALEESSGRNEQGVLLRELQAVLFSEKPKRGRDAVLNMIERLAAGPSHRPVREAGRIINNFPEIRLQAYPLLGLKGDLKTSAFIVNILPSETDQQVRREMVKALGDLGSDPDGRVSETITLISTDIREEAFIIAVIDSLEKISRYNGTVSFNAIRRLLEISRGPYSASVRNKASDVLRKLY